MAKKRSTQARPQAQAQAVQADTETPQAAEPVAPPTAAPEPDAPDTQEEDPLAGLSDDGNEPFVDHLLGQARDLDDEKANLYGRIDANRTTLRTIQNTGLLSEKQSRAIDLFYPKRQVKAKETEAAAAA